ncbi:choline transporter-like family protein [bacterium]|nr:choline transporter-like family protein [bacterium]
MFWVLAIVQLVLVITIYTGTNMDDKFGVYTYQCPQNPTSGQDFYYFSHKYKQSLIDDICACRASNSNWSRRLSTTSDERTMFDILADYVYIPIVGVIVVLALAFVWLLAMKYFGQTFIWISMAMIIAIKITMAILLFSVDGSTPAIIIIVFTSIFALYLFCRREVINRAGVSLETACKGLWKNPSIFIILTPIECVYLLYVFLWIFAWSQSWKIGSVDSLTCSVSVDSKGQQKMWFSSFLILWITMYINHVKVNVVGATLGAWAFGQEEDGSWTVSCAAAKWSFWNSSPTLALSSVICSVVEYLKRLAENKCNKFNPACCVFMIIMYCLMSVLQAFGRFCVVLHSITGKPFYESAYHSFKLLVKGGNIESAIAADYFIGLALGLTSYFLSLGVGFMMWAWGDEASGLKTLDPNADDWKTWFWILFVMFVIMNRYPYWSTFILAIIGGNSSIASATDAKSSIVLMAMFGANIAHIVFAFFAAIVLDGVDTIVMCYAIDKANGLAASDYSKKDPIVASMYVKIDDLVTKKGESSDDNSKA